ASGVSTAPTPLAPSSLRNPRRLGVAGSEGEEGMSGAIPPFLSSSLRAVKNVCPPTTSWPDRLDQAAAMAGLVFFAAAARAGLIATDLRHVAFYRQYNLRFLRCAIDAAAAVGDIARGQRGTSRQRAAGGTSARGWGVIARRFFRSGRSKQVMRQAGEEFLEAPEVRRAAEEIVENLKLHLPHQLDEHLVRLVLVLDERILLSDRAQIHAFAQRIHRVEMLLPQAI